MRPKQPSFSPRANGTRNSSFCSSVPNFITGSQYERVVHAHDHAGRGAAAADLLHRQRVADVVEPGAAVLLGHRHAQQAELGQLLHQLRRVKRAPRPTRAAFGHAASLRRRTRGAVFWIISLDRRSARSSCSSPTSALELRRAASRGTPSCPPSDPAVPKSTREGLPLELVAGRRGSASAPVRRSPASPAAIASGPLDAIFSAHCLRVGHAARSAGEHLEHQARRAAPSSASIMSPVKISSFAARRADARGSRWVPPKPGMTPRFTSGWPNFAFSRA